ncbi:3-hydroxyanthranilate 3,4-dioxygenase [Malassezia sp. CBS 17886]|nr:3-hydroxyanthranilate 3,4-dioxygenase [Malassezia sp. CBS 17886]
MLAPPFNFGAWVEENRHLLKPPVGNKCLLRTDAYFLMVVGGPNERSDFHYQPTEELFYQVQGKMTLRVIDNGKFRAIDINEGELFLLPGNVPHTPVRYPDTVGLVLERTRSVPDQLFWYCPNSSAHPEPHRIHQAEFDSAKLFEVLPVLLNEWAGNEALRTCNECGYVAGKVESVPM